MTDPKDFPETAKWSFKLGETSPGNYKIDAVCVDGRVLSVRGTDISELYKMAEEAVRELSKDHPHAEGS